MCSLRPLDIASANARIAFERSIHDKSDYKEFLGVKMATPVNEPNKAGSSVTTIESVEFDNVADSYWRSPRQFAR